MRKTQSALILCVLFVLVAATSKNAWSGPASPFPYQVDQPAGKITLTNKGDEYQGWTETLSGYTVIRNSAGFMEYAAQNSDGTLKPSGIRVMPIDVESSSSKDILPPKGLRPPRRSDIENQNSLNREEVRGSVGRQGPSSGPWTPYPVSGAKKLLVILVSFTDRSLVTTPSDWYNKIFSTSPGALSVANYYKENSSNLLTISPVPHTQVNGTGGGIVSVMVNRTHPNSGSNYNYSDETNWINMALAQAGSFVDFNSLDTNNDGTLETSEVVIYFILAGYEASGSSYSPNIWAHAWSGPGVSAGSSKAVYSWALNGELNNASTQQGFGVLTHELGHSMGGLPDLYDTSYTNQGLGIFSLMSYGSWGADFGESGGDRPVALDAWSRIYLGWATARVPSVNASNLDFPAAVSSGNQYSSVKLVNPSLSASEYFLVENRTPTRWDGGMRQWLGQTWSGGLLVQHIDINIGSSSNNGTPGSNNINLYGAGPHQGVMAVEATNDCSLKSTSGSSVGCLGVLFFNGKNSAFGKTTTPNSNLYSGQLTSRGLTNISVPSSLMTATFQTDEIGAFKIGDFNYDGKTDILVENTTTGEKGIWFTNGLAITSGKVFVTTDLAWRIVGTGDFNYDRKSDILVENIVTGERGIWYMDGSTIASGKVFATVSTNWKIVGVGDFNYDGKTDILVENSVTGEKGIWYMNGSVITSGKVFVTTDLAWKIVGTGDFNYDGKSDILVENTATGARGIWYMNGAIITSGKVFAMVSTDWKIAGTGDFDYDGKSDIIVQNTVTGERGIWFMNGNSVTSGAVFRTVSTDWKISQ